MLGKAKYKLNQKVWTVTQRRKQAWDDCKACAGAGRITLADGIDRSCPACFGRGKIGYYLELSWEVLPELTIGQIKVEVTNFEKDDIFDNIGHFKEGSTVTKVQYMMYETGIGSGSVYNEEDLFDSLEKASQECKRLNEVKA